MAATFAPSMFWRNLTSGGDGRRKSEPVGPDLAKQRAGGKESLASASSQMDALGPPFFRGHDPAHRGGGGVNAHLLVVMFSEAFGRQQL
jgi:hypothetical protein